MGNETKSTKTKLTTAGQTAAHYSAAQAKSASAIHNKKAHAQKSTTQVAKPSADPTPKSTPKAKSTKPTKAQVAPQIAAPKGFTDKSKTAETKATNLKTTEAKTAKGQQTTKTSKSVAKIKPRPLMRIKKKTLPKVKIETAEIVSTPPETSPEAAKTNIPTENSKDQPAKTATPKAEQVVKPKKEKKSKVKIPRIHRIYIKARYIVSAAILLILTGFFARVAVWEHNYIIAKEGSERDVVSTTTEEPVYEGGSASVDTTEPTKTEIAKYHVAPDKPRYLTIKMLGIYNARVVEIGLEGSGELSSPRNIYDVGWYTGSALPGSAGVSLIDAHGGDLGYGIFRNLPKIKVGDEINIEMGDEKTVYTYIVYDAVTKNIGTDANNYMKTAFTSPDGSPSLTLITCTGDWWQASQTYNKRLFVRATLKQN